MEDCSEVNHHNNNNKLEVVSLDHRSNKEVAQLSAAEVVAYSAAQTLLGRILPPEAVAYSETLNNRQGSKRQAEVCLEVDYRREEEILVACLVVVVVVHRLAEEQLQVEVCSVQSQPVVVCSVNNLRARLVVAVDCNYKVLVVVCLVEAQLVVLAAGCLVIAQVVVGCFSKT